MPGPQRPWMLHTGEQEQRPSNAVFTKVRNNINMEYAPPVVSISSRCVQESKRVSIHARTHTHSLRLVWDIARRRIIPARLQSILTNTVYVPSCPQQ